MSGYLLPTSGQTGTAGGPLDSLKVAVMSDQRDLAIMIVVPQADAHKPRLVQICSIEVLKFANGISEKITHTSWCWLKCVLHIGLLCITSRSPSYLDREMWFIDCS